MEAFDASLDATAGLPPVPGIPCVVAHLSPMGMPPVAAGRGKRSAPGGTRLNRAGAAPTVPSDGQSSPAPQRAAGLPHGNVARRAVGSRKPVVSAAAYRAATLGMTVVRHASIEVTEAGVFAEEVPTIWRVRAGSQPLPIVAICFSMLEAILLIKPKLDKKQLQSLSVWSDGFLS